MSVWTILFLLYTTETGEKLETKILFPSLKSCSKNMSVMLNPLRQIYPVADAYCVSTTTYSTSMRPKARPKSAGDD